MMKQINTVPPLKLQLPIWASDKEYVHIHPLHMYFVHEYSIFHYDPFCLTGLWLVCLLRQWAESASCGQYQKCRQLPLRHLSFTHTPRPYTRTRHTGLSCSFWFQTDQGSAHLTLNWLSGGGEPGRGKHERKSRRLCSRLSCHWAMSVLPFLKETVW